MFFVPNPDFNVLGRDPLRQPQQICIIGAGPGGLAALQIIMQSPQYKTGLWRPTVYEQREKVGGVWVPAPPVDDPPITPLYDSLTTNLPHPVMCFDSYPFPPSTPLFPPASIVEKYLSDFAEHFGLMQHIRLNTPVLAVDWDAAKQRWKVRVLGNEEPLEYDLLFVANGHHRVPRMPTVPGLQAWLEQGKAIHSVWYRRPEGVGDTVLVVGGGPSGNDVSFDMRTTGRTVVHSVTNGVPEDLDGGKLKRRGRLAEFLDPATGTVRFVDGTTESGIDDCILATGYQHAQPYLPPHLLRLSVPPPVPPLPSGLYNSTYHLFPLARHLFPLTDLFPPQRAAFLGLLKGAAPLALMEAQVRATLALFGDPALFDAPREAVGIVARYEDLRARIGASELHIASAWHVFQHSQDQFDYRDELHAWIGEEARVPQWTREFYDARDVLRGEWRDLERLGEAEHWVRGVGEGGVDEWIELMRKLVKRAKERKKDAETEGECQSKL